MSGRGGFRGGGRNFRGGGRYSGGRNSYRGGGAGGRDQSYGGGKNGNEQQERCTFTPCKFFTLGVKECSNGDNCSYSHHLAVAFDFKAHESAIKSLAVISDGPQVLTGSTDNSIKVWNFSQGKPELSTTLPTGGSVQHIEIKDNTTVMYSSDEYAIVTPPTDAQNGSKVPVGVVKVLNPSDGSSVPIKRSEEFPYTHPQPVNSFVVLNGPNGLPYVISCGGEGLIRMWKFEGASNSFEHVGMLEGHIRGVTSLILHETNLWSGSLDTTLRVWDMNTSKCLGVLSNAQGGHSAAISCLVNIPPSAPVGTTSPGAPSSGFIASGSMDGEVKLWQYSGEIAWSGAHSAPASGIGVTSLCVFQDALGGQQNLLIGLTDGRILARSCVTMNLMFSLDQNTLLPNKTHTETIWSIASLGHSCFVSSDNSGRVMVWKAYQPLIDNR